MNGIQRHLIKLYRKLANHTLPECRMCYIGALSCCATKYCRYAADHARRYWGVTLEPHPEHKVGIPFLGPQGCIVVPHLRPLCTMHVCCINRHGGKPGDPQWTERYFRLRDRIREVERARGVEFELVRDRV